MITPFGIHLFISRAIAGDVAIQVREKGNYEPMQHGPDMNAYDYYISFSYAVY
ncbi:hypothetical protein [Deinococcus sp. PESE-13]